MLVTSLQADLFLPTAMEEQQLNLTYFPRESDVRRLRQRRLLGSYFSSLSGERSARRDERSRRVLGIRLCVPMSGTLRLRGGTPPPIRSARTFLAGLIGKTSTAVPFPLSNQQVVEIVEICGLDTLL